MGKTTEYPADFKLKAIQSYLEGNHGRISKSGRNIWNERYKMFKEMGKTV